MKRLASTIEWSGDDIQTRRFAPAIDCSDEHIREFAVFGLSRCLGEFGVGSYEGAGVATWFWKASRSWARQETQSDFDKYARARVSDYVGYTRRRADAFHIVNALFDKARFVGTTFDEIVGAITFLSKSEPLPPEKIVENGATALIDLTLRRDSPKVLKVDLDFLPVLCKLYPFERVDDTVIKYITPGEINSREFNLVKLCWWSQHSDTTLEEMAKAISFRDGDRMNWTKENLYSRWRASAAAHEALVPAEYPEFCDANGDTRTVPNEYVGLSPAVSAGLTLNNQPIDPPAKATKTARVLNWLKEITAK